MPNLPADPLDLDLTAPIDAERAAIKEFAHWLTVGEGRGAGRDDIKLWLAERGWPPNKARLWGEQVAAQMALADPNNADVRFLAAKVNNRLERIAHKAEDFNDFKHAIAATEAQAKLHRLGGFAPSGAPTVAIQVNAASAHLVSDEDLARIAAQAVPAQPIPAQAVPTQRPEDDPLCQ